jgi:hypothetical protein
MARTANVNPGPDDDPDRTSADGGHTITRK